jgi:DNA-binding MarR family transcriptional regulator
VIRLIGRNPGLSAKDIAGRAHHHPSTLSIILRSLEGNGHVLRKVDSQDARRVRLELSASGKRLDRKQRGTVESAVRLALARLDPNEVEVVRRALGVLVEELERGAGAEEPKADGSPRRVPRGQ